MISGAIRHAAAGLAGTWRFSTAGAEHLARLREGETPFIFALWHRELLPLLWFHRGRPTTIIASAHRDGRYVADAARRWGYRTVTGSSRRGGVGALRRAVRVLRNGGEVAVAVDGPTGPPGVAKPGVLTAARLADVPILPVVAVAGMAWEARSWDRFLVPRPFTGIHIAYGEPLEVALGARPSRDAVRELETRLHSTREAVAA